MNIDEEKGYGKFPKALKPNLAQLSIKLLNLNKDNNDNNDNGDDVCCKNLSTFWIQWHFYNFLLTNDWKGHCFNELWQEYQTFTIYMYLTLYFMLVFFIIGRVRKRMSDVMTHDDFVYLIGNILKQFIRVYFW